MKKKYIILWLTYIVLLIITVLSTLAAITVTGGGALDLSNIARGVLIIIDIVSGIALIVVAQNTIQTK